MIQILFIASDAYSNSFIASDAYSKKKNEVGLVLLVDDEGISARLQVGFCLFW